MSIPANVRSIGSIRHFKAALVRYEEEAASALSSLRQDVNRFLDWLEHDRPAFWRQQMRRAHDDVAEARSRLNRKQIITVGGHRPECIEEKQDLQKAKRRLELAQRKIEIVRQWNVKAHQAADDYTAQLGRCEQALTQELPRMTALLERILAALESYAESEASADAPEVRVRGEKRRRDPPAGQNDDPANLNQSNSEGT